MAKLAGCTHISTLAGRVLSEDESRTVECEFQRLIICKSVYASEWTNRNQQDVRELDLSFGEAFIRKGETFMLAVDRNIVCSRNSNRNGVNLGDTDVFRRCCAIESIASPFGLA
jgi:hypothetical protein